MEESYTKDSRRLERMLCLLLLTMTLAVFQNVAGYEFVNFDDIQYITENPNVRAGLTWHSVGWAFTTGHAGNWHPLTWLSHMFDVQLFGLNPGLHHMMNLIIHMANTVLLFIFLKRTSGAVWRSALVAGMFAVHPLHVESVAWVSERKDVLSGLFWMLSLWAYEWYAKRPCTGRYAKVLLLVTMGLMCKPMLVTLPFVFLLLDLWPLGRFQPNSDLRKANGVFESPGVFHLVLEKVPFFLLAGFSSVLTYSVQKKAGLVVSSQIYPLDLRLANAVVSYVNYIGKLLWPEELSVYYPHPETIPVWEYLGAGICLAALSALFLCLARKRRYLAIGWLWFIGTLVPVIGLVHVGGQAMADRYTYIPSIGIFILLAWGIPDLLGERKKWRVAFIVAAVIVLSTYGLRAWMQVGFWKNSVSLWEQTLRVTGANYVAHNMLGGALARLGMQGKAMHHFYESLRIRPDYEKAHYYVGLTLMEQGRYNESESHFIKALGGSCDFPELILDMLGRIHLQRGRPEKGEEQFRTALRLNPMHDQSRLDLGIAMEQLGREAEAMHEYSRVLEIDPANAPARFHIGRILYRQGRIQEAVIHYAEALTAHPDLAEAHYNMGVVLDHTGRKAEAAHHYSAAVRLKPDFVEARNNLGVMLAQQGRCQEAALHFTTVLRLQPDHAGAKSNLDLCLGGVRRGKEKTSIERRVYRKDFPERGS